jgi:hypothetical protein
VTISLSTITGNVVAHTLTTYGGGINSVGTTSLNNTIVAGNLRGATTRDDVKGTFTSSYSLIGDKRDAMLTDTGGSQIGTSGAPIDAKLGPLANNGGSTLTHSLMTGSPALDAGDPAAVAGQGGVPLYDERGSSFPRVVDFDGAGGARIDIGAVEMAAGPSGPALPGDYNLNHVVDAGDYVLWRKTVNTNVSPVYAGADGDGNGVINGSDYTVWRLHFGNTGAAGEGTAVEVSSDSDKPASAPLALFDIGMASALADHQAIVVARESQVGAMDEAIELLAGVGEAEVGGSSSAVGRDGQIGGLPDEDSPTGDASADAGLVLVGVGASL